MNISNINKLWSNEKWGLCWYQLKIMLKILSIYVGERSSCLRTAEASAARNQRKSLMGKTKVPQCSSPQATALELCAYNAKGALAVCVHWVYIFNTRASWAICIHVLWCSSCSPFPLPPPAQWLNDLDRWAAICRRRLTWIALFVCRHVCLNKIY